MRLLCAFLALCALASAQTGVIAGTVIDAVNDQPVRRAIVTATAQGTPRRWATVRTDSSGEFRFEKLPPGKYDCQVTVLDPPGQKGTFWQAPIMVVQ